MSLKLSFFDTVKDHYVPGATEIYAMVFDDFTNQALRFADAPSEIFMSAFDGTQGDFAINLSGANPRTSFYETTPLASAFHLADSQAGRYYTIEYWAASSAGVKDRSVDFFLSAEKFHWQNELMFDSRISVVQEQAIADKVNTSKYEVMASCVFDSVISRLGVTAWLEKNGELQTTAKSASIHMVDSEGNDVATPVSNTVKALGQFNLQTLSLSLLPDENYFASVTIVDENDEEHTSGIGVVAWD